MDHSQRGFARTRLQAPVERRDAVCLLLAGITASEDPLSRRMINVEALSHDSLVMKASDGSNAVSSGSPDLATGKLYFLLCQDIRPC